MVVFFIDVKNYLIAMRFNLGEITYLVVEMILTLFVCLILCSYVLKKQLLKCLVWFGWFPLWIFIIT